MFQSDLSPHCISSLSTDYDFKTRQRNFQRTTLVFNKLGPPPEILIIKTCISELTMSSAKGGLGLGARGLKDKDWGPGVSDPYVVISR